MMERIEFQAMNLLDLSALMTTAVQEIASRPVPVPLKHMLQDACSELNTYAATKRRPSVLPPRKD